MPRIFLAIELPEVVKNEVKIIQKHMQSQFPHSKVSWVQKENFHITLHFLGEIPIEAVERLKKEFEAVEFPEKFSLTLKAANAFPHHKNPKTLYLEASIHPFLLILRRRLANIIVNMGIHIDGKPFAPHITLGRVISRAETLKPECLPVTPINWRVKTVTLMQSTLTPEGSIYTPLKTYALPGLPQ